MIMGDICDTIDELLSPMGEDHYMLNRQELDDNSFSRLTYTDRDKIIMHQFERAAMPAKMYSKFTQDKRDTWSYILFESRLVIDMHRSDTFTTVEGQYQYY
jgi:hypothetical protein